jgi:hypothetical protein
MWLILRSASFLAGLVYFDWRRRHKDDLPVDRWGYFPPEERTNP